MNNLQYRQEKIQAKRKKTPRRDFVRDICSWYSVNLYKNNGIVSRFPESDRCGIIYNVTDYRKEYGEGFQGIDLKNGIPFHKQFQNFFATSPKMTLLDYGQNENVGYADTIYGAKNVYISISVGDNSQDILYSNMVFGQCQTVISSFLITNHTQNIYFCKVVTNSFDIFYSKYIHNSDDVWFSTNLIGCRHCLFCSGLENQSHYIHNIPYSKEEFIIKKQEILSQKNKYEGRFSTLDNKAQDKVTNNCSGNSISFSNNIHNAYYVARVTDGRNIFCGDGTPIAERLYDVVDLAKVDDAYGWMGVGQNSSHMYCGSNASTCNNVYYCYFMDTCSFCLGCIGLKNKQFCILNKQYSKDERYAKVDEIFGQMEKDGTLGEFFPASMNPFYFNDTAAYLIDNSFTKEEVTAAGYLWRDEPIKVDIPEGSKIVKTSELDQYEGWKHESSGTIADDLLQGQGDSSTSSEGRKRRINPDILKCIIQDESGNVYRIVKMEYEFLIKYELPLPRKHRLDRMKENFRIQDQKNEG